jgi:hypothetical protein
MPRDVRFSGMPCALPTNTVPTMLTFCLNAGACPTGAAVTGALTGCAVIGVGAGGVGADGVGGSGVGAGGVGAGGVGAGGVGFGGVGAGGVGAGGVGAGGVGAGGVGAGGVGAGGVGAGGVGAGGVGAVGGGPDPVHTSVQTSSNALKSLLHGHCPALDPQLSVQPITRQSATLLHSLPTQVVVVTKEKSFPAPHQSGQKIESTNRVVPCLKS